MDDFHIIQKVANGDREAFQLLLDRYEKKVFRYFYRCFNNYHIAEDLAQNVFVAILKQVPKNGHKWLLFSHYLFKICKNTALQYARKMPVLVPLDDLSYCETEKEDESQEILYQKIAQLPILERQCILLKFLEGFSISEVAKILDMPENTVKSHIFRGKKKLRSELAIYFEDEYGHM